MSEKVREMFDKIHKRYDYLNHLLSAGRDIAWRKKSLRNLPQNQNATVLDLCGGTGDFALAYNKIVGTPALMIVGDFSKNMLAEAAKKGGELKLTQLDAEHLPIKNESLDVVLNGFGMRNVPNTQNALKEISNALKPGGYFVTLEFFKPANLLPKFFYENIAPLTIPFVGMLFSKRNAYRYLVLSILRFLTVNEYAKQAREAGFKLCCINAYDGGLAHLVLCQKK